MDTIAEVEKIAERKEELLGEVSALGKTISQLENLINDKRLVVEGIEKDIATIDSQKTVKELELKEAEQETAKAQELMRVAKIDASATITKLGEDVGDYQAKIAFFKEQLHDAKVSMAETQEAIKNEYALLEKVKAEYKEFSDTTSLVRVHLTGEVEALQKDHGTATALLAEKKGEVEVVEGQIVEVKAKLIDVQSELEAGYVEKERINTANMVAEKAHNESMMNLAQILDAEITSNREWIATAKEELAEVEKDLESKNAQAISLVARTAQLDQREEYLKEKYARAGIQW